MNKEGNPPVLNKELWHGTSQEVAKEISSFISEFGSFTPEWFIEVKFHLLRQQGLTKESRDELCEVSIHNRFCRKCDMLYAAKKCPLWYRLFRLIPREGGIMSRAPPCMRLARLKNRIKTVANFLAKVNLIDPPFYYVRAAPSCKSLRRWGYCHPDKYCEVMKTDITLEYCSAREKVKLMKPIG